MTPLEEPVAGRALRMTQPPLARLRVIAPREHVDGFYGKKVVSCFSEKPVRGHRNIFGHFVETD
jgi:hypothetical protein